MPRRIQTEGTQLLRKIPQSESVEEARRRRDEFLNEFEGYPKACDRLLHDWERMVAFYEFPKEHWKALRTSNTVESPFQVVRLRTGAARRYRKVENATAVLWKLLMIAETTFKVFDAVHLLEEVANNQEYVNGIPRTLARRKSA